MFNFLFLIYSSNYIIPVTHLQRKYNLIPMSLGCKFVIVQVEVCQIKFSKNNASIKLSVIPVTWINNTEY